MNWIFFFYEAVKTAHLQSHSATNPKDQQLILNSESLSNLYSETESEEAVLTHGAAATGTPFTRPNLHFPLLRDRTRRRENEWLWGEERESGKTREETVSKRGHGSAMSGMLMTPVTWPSLNIDWSALRPDDLSAHCSCSPDPGSVFSFREKTCVTYSSLRWTGCRSGGFGGVC